MRRIRALVLIALGLGVLFQIGARFGPQVFPPTPVPLDETLVGDSMPDVTLSWGSSDGRLVEHVPDRGCAYVYFFSSTCSACQNAAPAWSGTREINGYPVVWVSLDDDRQTAERFLKQFQVPAELGTVLTGSGYRSLGVRATPTVWQVQDGRVTDMFVGTWETAPERLRDAACPT